MILNIHHKNDAWVNINKGVILDIKNNQIKVFTYNFSQGEEIFQSNLYMQIMYRYRNSVPYPYNLSDADIYIIKSSLNTEIKPCIPDETYSGYDMGNTEIIACIDNNCELIEHLGNKKCNPSTKQLSLLSRTMQNILRQTEQLPPINFKELNSNDNTSKVLNSNNNSSTVLNSNDNSSKILSSNDNSSTVLNSNDNSSTVLNSNNNTSQVLISNDNGSVALNSNDTVIELKSKNDENITVKINSEFSIKLGGCFVCGYSWEINYDTKIFEFKNEERECPDNLKFGQSCVLKRTYKALRLGKYKITGYFYRSWMVQKDGKGTETVWNINVVR